MKSITTYRENTFNLYQECRQLVLVLIYSYIKQKGKKRIKVVYNMFRERVVW